MIALMTSDVPDRLISLPVDCAAVVGDEDDWDDETPCPFAGTADIALFDDTEEAIWYCPNGHENSIRWASI